MEHKKVSRLLILAGAVAGVGGMITLFLLIPLAATETRNAYPELSGWFWPGLIYAWAVGALCLAALGEYLRISVRIGKNRSFCTENVRDMRMIAILLLAAAGLLLTGAVLVLAIGFGPVWLWLLLAAAACGAMAILAYALSRLLNRAVQLQEENDLTV